MLSIIRCTMALIVFTCLVSETSAQGVGSITRLEKDRVTIDWGVMDGTTVGMYFDVYKAMGRSTAELRNLAPDDPGFTGRIRVEELYNDYAIARFLVQKQDAAVGDFLQLVIDDATPLDVPGLRTDKGVITDVKQGIVSFNLGRADGVEAGLLFDVVKYVLRTDPESGKPADRKRLMVGKVAVVEVMPEQSLGRILSGEQNISAGDHMELSDRQRGDIEIARQEQKATGQRSASSVKPAALGPAGEKPVVLGRVDQYRGDQVDVAWKQGGVQYPVGSRLGVYRLEVVENSLTGVQMGAPLVRIGEVEITDINGEHGVGRVLSEDVAIRSGDLIGAAEPAAVQPVQTQSARLPTGRGITGPLARQEQARDEAYRLSSEIMSVQRELNDLKALNGRMNKLETTVRKNSTSLANLQRLMQRIDDRLTGNVTVDAGSSEFEIYRGNAGSAPVKRYVFSDDIDVKVMYKDNTAYLMLDIDSSSVESVRNNASRSPVAMKPAPDSVVEAVTSEERLGPTAEVIPAPEAAETSIDSLMVMGAESTIFAMVKKWGLFAGIGLGVIAALLMVLKLLKKKKTGTGGTNGRSRKKNKFDDEDEDLEAVAEEELEEEEV